MRKHGGNLPPSSLGGLKRKRRRRRRREPCSSWSRNQSARGRWDTPPQTARERQSSLTSRPGGSCPVRPPRAPCEFGPCQIFSGGGGGGAAPTQTFTFGFTFARIEFVGPPPRTPRPPPAPPLSCPPPRARSEQLGPCDSLPETITVSLATKRRRCVSIPAAVKSGLSPPTRPRLRSVTERRWRWSNLQIRQSQ